MKVQSKRAASTARKVSAIRSYMAVFLAVAVWYRTLLAEEEEGGGDVGSAYRAKQIPIPALEPHQQAYLDAVDQKIRAYSSLAARRLVRFRIAATGGLIAALLVPVVIATGAPGWIAAVLGAVAAMSQGLQQIFQDQRHAVGAHAVAVELSRARRRVGYALGKCATRSAQRSTFDAFVERVEDITETGDEHLIGILRNEAMPASLPSAPSETASGSGHP
jgi:hypothetical protein